MTTPAEYKKQISKLAEYLYARRESILNNWRTLCSVDKDMHTRTSFSREEFNDQLPVLLNILTQRILGEPDETDAVERAGQHGLHRWQRGYSLAELLNELANFYDSISEEIDAYREMYPETDSRIIALAYRQLLSLSRDISMGSVMYYDQLRQTGAAEQAYALQESLDKLQQVTSQRGQQLRRASHDLRSNFGIVSGAAQLLTLPVKPEEQKQFLDMLTRNLRETEHILNQLLDYARLEAAQETIDSKPFNAADLLRDVVKKTQEIAASKQLVLKADGPDELNVVGDPVMVQRLMQNLLLYALKYTQQGWVSVSWAMENDTRWIISVQDTGPGLAGGPSALLADQLQPLSQPTSSHQKEGPEGYPSGKIPATSNKRSEEKRSQPDREAMSLFIVKSLCELMKGSMDIETSGLGTLIRVRLLVNQKLSEKGR